VSSAIKRERTRLLDVQRGRHAWRLWVVGQVTAGDGSDKQGKVGAGYYNLRRKKQKQQCEVACDQESFSSNWPELAAFLLALRDTLIKEPLLYLCDNQSLLKAVTRWIGEG